MSLEGSRGKLREGCARRGMSLATETQVEFREYKRSFLGSGGRAVCEAGSEDGGDEGDSICRMSDATRPGRIGRVRDGAREDEEGEE